MFKPLSLLARQDFNTFDLLENNVCCLNPAFPSCVYWQTPKNTQAYLLHAALHLSMSIKLVFEVIGRSNNLFMQRMKRMYVGLIIFMGLLMHQQKCMIKVVFNLHGARLTSSYIIVSTVKFTSVYAYNIYNLTYLLYLTVWSITLAFVINNFDIV